MAQSQKPKTMKVEMMKSIKTGLVGMPILKFTSSSAFLVFPIMQKRLAITRIWLSQNRGKYCKFTVKTKVSGS